MDSAAGKSKQPTTRINNIAATDFNLAAQSLPTSLKYAQAIKAIVARRPNWWLAGLLFG
ncbi:MAG: hypothetical protein WCS94_12160 [Verrucomicrobiota bacterium]